MGSVYVGNGAVAGFDIYGGTYRGAYIERDGSLHLEVSLSMDGGGTLVTGDQVAPGQQIPIKVELPAGQWPMQTLRLSVGGKPVQVQLRRMVDFD